MEVVRRGTTHMENDGDAERGCVTWYHPHTMVATVVDWEGIRFAPQKALRRSNRTY